MDKQVYAVLRLGELRKQQQENVESVKNINRLRHKFGLSDKSYLEVIDKLNEEKEYILNQILEIKENL